MGEVLRNIASFEYQIWIKLYLRTHGFLKVSNEIHMLLRYRGGWVSKLITLPISRPQQIQPKQSTTI